MYVCVCMHLACKRNGTIQITLYVYTICVNRLTCKNRCFCSSSFRQPLLPLGWSFTAINCCLLATTFSSQSHIQIYLYTPIRCSSSLQLAIWLKLPLEWRRERDRASRPASASSSSSSSPPPPPPPQDQTSANRIVYEQVTKRRPVFVGC